MRSDGWFTSAREFWTLLRLRAGSLVLVGYAAAGSVIGIEIFAMLAVWPLGVGLLIATVVGGATVRRRRRKSAEA